MLTEKNQIGKREDLADYITRVDAKSKPYLAMVPKGPAISNMLNEFLCDDFEDPSDDAVEGGADVDNFDNAVPNRARIQTYAMKARESAMVDDLAENVSEVAGLSKGELAEAVMKKLEKLSRSIEAFLCGDQDHQAGASGVPYKIRGLGKWIALASSQSAPTVNTNYQTLAAQLDTTAMASITESLVQDIMESVYGVTGQQMKGILLCGPKLKRRFSTFTQVAASANVAQSVVRYYSTQFNHVIDNVVDQFNGDFGTIDLHLTLWNAHANFGGSAAANLRRGYLIPDMNLLELNYKRKPRVKQLEDRGGGPRFLCDAIFGSKCKNPKPFAKFAGTS